MGRKRKRSTGSHEEGNEEENHEEIMSSCGIPLFPSYKDPKSCSGVTFVLEKASLALAYVGKRYEILNSDDHGDFLRKKKKNPYDYRPDIVHQALVQIMDSWLCLAGRLRAVYIRTDEGLLIKVEPNTRIPGKLKSFCSMMAQLLQKLSIKAVGKRRKLLRPVDNPITKHLPPNARNIGLSSSSERTVPLSDYVFETGSDQEPVFVVGAMAHGKIESDYIDDLVSVPEPICLRSICIELERKWKMR